MEFFICAKANWLATDRITDEVGYNEEYLTQKFDAANESDARDKARGHIQDFRSSLPGTDSLLDIRKGDFRIIAFGQVLADP